MLPLWFTRRRVFIITSLFTASAIIIWRLFSRRRIRQCKQFPALDHVLLRQRHRQFPKFDVSNYHIEVVETAEACEEYLSTKIPSPLTIVGLDCEWCNEQRGSGIPVALLQLAFPNKECLLVRLCKMGDLTPTLTEILEDKSILKFGVGIDGDSKRLTAAGFGLRQVAGCVDLQHIAVRSGLRSRTGLRGLSNQLLEVDLDKSHLLQCSDWETDTLSEQQVTYAAADAIVALHILKALVQMKTLKQDRRESAATLTQSTNHNAGNRSHDLDQEMEQHTACHGIEWLLQDENYSCMLSLCQGIVDMAFKQPKGSSAVNKHAISETKRRTAAYIIRKSPLYHNCQLLAPDGTLLSTVDKRKLEWYIQRGLGTLVSESPLTVKLLFEPSGRPSEDRKYYLTEKLNVCVVCGSEENCIRKNIVPHEYRRHFPTQKKEHLSHDVLLMCIKCHQKANRHDAALKQSLSEECGVPLIGSSQRYSEDPWLMKVKNHAKALLRTDADIPESRRQELMSTVAQHFDCSVEEVSQDLIKQASEVNSKSHNAGYVSHAEAVVSKVKLKDGGVFEFQKRWRQNFLDTMHPMFLPEFWSVDHNPQS